MGRHKEDPQLRFESKFSVGYENKCWEWKASKTPKGYGVFWTGDKFEFAHRYMYSMYNGNIPPNLHVCHACDNPGCVNPDHLWLGTNLENRLDSKKKQRVPKGPAHWNYQSGIFTKPYKHDGKV